MGMGIAKRAERMMRRRAVHKRSAGSDPDGVVAWRTRQLHRAGFDRALAGAVAGDPRTDVHALIELVDRGCPPPLAARILAPLDDAPAEQPR
jgi:hypothetical protein